MKNSLKAHTWSWKVKGSGASLFLTTSFEDETLLFHEILRVAFLIEKQIKTLLDSLTTHKTQRNTPRPTITIALNRRPSILELSSTLWQVQAHHWGLSKDLRDKNYPRKRVTSYINAWFCSLKKHLQGFGRIKQWTRQRSYLKRCPSGPLGRHNNNARK